MGEVDKFRRGDQVVLVAIPPGLLDGLPEDDQRAIRAIIGTPVTLLGYDERGYPELHFADPFKTQSHEYSHTHSIWVPPEFVKPHHP